MKKKMRKMIMRRKKKMMRKRMMMKMRMRMRLRINQEMQTPSHHREMAILQSKYLRNLKKLKKKVLPMVCRKFLQTKRIPILKRRNHLNPLLKRGSGPEKANQKVFLGLIERYLSSRGCPRQKGSGRRRRPNRPRTPQPLRRTSG